MSPFLQAGCALPRAVEQFHYLLWPDHGVPRNPSQLLGLVEVVNKRVLEAPAGPVLVHCSAGIGRTGTFIALDFLLKMGKAEGKVDVFHCVQQLREQRVSMVQTKVRNLFPPPACASHSLLGAEPGCDELRGQRGANMSCSEQGWVACALSMSSGR
uniref:protein-tyrosine-phosphatase n=1 Tax=Serinus canaria TaxID=9135 RepID=A0A8C9MHK8_SERCA